MTLLLPKNKVKSVIVTLIVMLVSINTPMELVNLVLIHVKNVPVVENNVVLIVINHKEKTSYSYSTTGVLPHVQMDIMVVQ